MILVDTGPLVAAANRNDTHHQASTEALAAARRPRLVPGMVIAEVGYLLARDAGFSVEAGFLRSFETGFLDIVSPTADDLARAADLVEQYADLPLGTTDACIVALAERLNITELVTLDQRHFNVVHAERARAPIRTPRFTPQTVWQTGNERGR
ncbi:MAG TPA: PIN domain-containing protein [Solirubrobacteraceae bacterium]|jgi:predicted nucleic acid-binding protein|nr:PIN domain-containing protein [Solirubrobacteraceae bacterium]